MLIADNVWDQRYWKTVHKIGSTTAADVKKEIPGLLPSPKSSILSSTSSQLEDTFWEVVSAAVEQSRQKTNMVAQEDGKFRALRLTTETLQ